MTQTPLLPVESVAITGCGPISPIGMGFDAFVDGLRTSRDGLTELDGWIESPLPAQYAHVIVDFDVARALGKKGTRFFDRTTALTVAACGLALESANVAPTAESRLRTGVVLGTSTGSIKSVVDFTSETLVQDRPYLVNPVLFPNTVMNCAAGQAAIWHHLRGVNATVSGGQLSSLLAVRYATVALRQRYADVLLVGGVEEFCPQTAWGHWHAEQLLQQSNAAVGEGCAMFVVERMQSARDAGRTVLAEVLACEVRQGDTSSSTADPAESLACCIRRALERAAVAATEIDIVSTGFVGDAGRDRTEAQGLCLALGRLPETCLDVKRQVGECYSAAGGFQLAALLASFQPHPGPRRRVALVTSVSPNSGVGCAVIREGGA